MKVIYFDCFAGAAGDMILGALLDAGLPFDELRAALGSLPVEGWSVSAERVLRAGVSATKFRVHETGGHTGAGNAEKSLRQGAEQEPHRGDPSESPEHAHPHAHTDAQGRRFVHSHPHDHDSSHQHSHGRHHHQHRTLAEIHAAIDRSALSTDGRARAKALFDRLADAESATHRTPRDQVHLHEVGALDSIIDIVGAVFAFEWFGADRIVVSPINVGAGMVQTAHGRFPVPAPATVRLLGEAPVYADGPAAELLTPTGALLLSSYATGFGPLPRMRVLQAGYGAGDRDFAGTPNTLRVLVGDADDRAPATRVVVIECEIDDMNPQLFGPLMDRLTDAGALDVFYAPVQMKKGRPGTLVTILAPVEERAALTEVMFRETTTIGVRFTEAHRECLEREMTTVETGLGAVRFKVARRAGAVLNVQPEFDDLVRLAAERAIPVKEVQAAAWKAWLDHA